MGLSVPSNRSRTKERQPCFRVTITILKSHGCPRIILQIRDWFTHNRGQNSRLDVTSRLAMASRKRKEKEKKEERKNLFLEVPVSKMVKDGASNNYVNKRSTTAKPLPPSLGQPHLSYYKLDAHYPVLPCPLIKIRA